MVGPLAGAEAVRVARCTHEAAYEIHHRFSSPQRDDGAVSSSDRWDERDAEQIVALVTCGTSHTRDIASAPPGTHDFDIELPDGRIIAVEVTRSNARTRTELLAAVYQFGATADHGWILQGLASSWHLILDPFAHVRDLHAEVVALLTDAAQAGHDQFRPRSDGRLYELGVRAVFKKPQIQPPQVVCALLEDDFDPVVLGPPTGSVLARVVDQEAPRKAAKLARTEAAERHLYIWVEISQRTVLADMEFAGTPRTTPNLPAGVDAVWLVDAFWPGRVRVYKPADGWADYGTWSADISAVRASRSIAITRPGSR
jgi:hypothetical protein